MKPVGPETRQETEARHEREYQEYRATCIATGVEAVHYVNWQFRKKYQDYVDDCGHQKIEPESFSDWNTP